MDIRYISTAGYDFYYELAPTVSGIEIVVICPPEFEAHEEGEKYIDIDITEPGLRSILEDLMPDIKGELEDLPDIDGDEIGPPKIIPVLPKIICEYEE